MPQNTKFDRLVISYVPLGSVTIVGCPGALYNVLITKKHARNEREEML